MKFLSQILILLLGLTYAFLGARPARAQDTEGAFPNVISLERHHRSPMASVRSKPCAGGDSSDSREGLGIAFTWKEEAYVLTVEAAVHAGAGYCAEVAPFHATIGSFVPGERAPAPAPRSFTPATLIAADWGYGLALLKLPSKDTLGSVPPELDALKPAAAVSGQIAYYEDSPAFGKVLIAQSPRHLVPQIPKLMEVDGPGVSADEQGAPFFSSRGEWWGLLSNQYLKMSLGGASVPQPWPETAGRRRWEEVQVLVIPAPAAAEWARKTLEGRKPELVRGTPDSSGGDVVYSGAFAFRLRCEKTAERPAGTDRAPIGGTDHAGVGGTDHAGIGGTDHAGIGGAGRETPMEIGGAADPATIGGESPTAPSCQVIIGIAASADASVSQPWATQTYWLKSAAESLRQGAVPSSDYLIYRDDEGLMTRRFFRSLAEFFRFAGRDGYRVVLNSSVREPRFDRLAAAADALRSALAGEGDTSLSVIIQHDAEVLLLARIQALCDLAHSVDPSLVSSEDAARVLDPSSDLKAAWDQVHFKTDSQLKTMQEAAAALLQEWRQVERR